MSRVQESVWVRALPEKPAHVAGSMASHRGHAFVIDKKLLANEHEMISRRRAQSVPGPGVGH